MDIALEHTILGNSAKSIIKKHMAISIQFSSNSIFYIQKDSAGRFELQEEETELLTKDYDSLESPLEWVDQWDLSNWVSITALKDNNLVGALLLALRTENVNMLEGRNDLAIIWDIRVHPSVRGQGVGSMMVNYCEKWCRDNGIDELRVETQTNNSTAVRFYQKSGFQLLRVNEKAYDDLDEVQVIFSKYI